MTALSTKGKGPIIVNMKMNTLRKKIEEIVIKVWIDNAYKNAIHQEELNLYVDQILKEVKECVPKDWEKEFDRYFKYFDKQVIDWGTNKDTIKNLFKDFLKNIDE